MSTSLGYDDDARWLQSDGSIIGKVHRKPDPQGIRLTLDMPDGEPVVAVVEKLNAAAMTQFCDIARNTYNERKAEQAVKAERTSRESEERKGRESLEREEPVQDVQVSMEVNPMDPQSVSRRLIEIGSRISSLSEEIKALDKEGTLLYKIMEVLNDASNDDEEAGQGVQTTTPSPNEGEGAVSAMDQRSCEDQLLKARETGTVEVDKGLELTSPDPDAKGGSVDHND